MGRLSDKYLTDEPELFEAKYPHAPGYKARDTAKAAADAMESPAKTLRAAVEKVIFSSHAGMTADEVAAKLKETVLSIRPRVSELVAQGKITDSGLRRANISGHKAIVWIRTLPQERGRKDQIA